MTSTRATRVIVTGQSWSAHLSGKPASYFVARTAPGCILVAVLQYCGNSLDWSGAMAMSVRLDPTLETRVAQESRRLGITKSEFVKEALERVLGLKNPADLLSTVRSGKAMGNPRASRNVSASMKARLRAKLPD